MSDSLQYINLIRPDGLAFSNVDDSEIFNEVLAEIMDDMIDSVKEFQSQVWYVDDDFDPELWEKWYDIDVSEYATLSQRSSVVHARRLWPISDYMTSLDQMQAALDSAGFDTVTISTNESGTAIGTLHGNNITTTENYSVGSDSYNSIILTGSIDPLYYEDMILLIMSIKPIWVAVYDNVSVYQAFSFDDYSFVFDDDAALILKS